MRQNKRKQSNFNILCDVGGGSNWSTYKLSVMYIADQFSTIFRFSF